jgi:beta-glucosidase
VRIFKLKKELFENEKRVFKLINRAASFNIDIVKNVARITAEETRAVGVPWNFNPVLDVGRQPLWPRMYETYGEDHFVGKEIKTFLS